VQPSRAAVNDPDVVLIVDPHSDVSEQPMIGPRPSPQRVHRSVGRRSGPRLVIHRGAGGLHDNEKGLELKPPISECLPHGPADTGVRSGRQPRPVLGRPGTGLRMAGGSARVHVDYKGNVWLGGNGKGDARS